jgi:hypothetical protein
MRLAFALAVSVELVLSGASYAQGVGAACHFKALCPGVQPGGGRVIKCLSAHKEELSQQCLAAIGLRVLNRQHGGGGQAAPDPMGEGPDGGDSPGGPPPNAPGSPPPNQ